MFSVNAAHWTVVSTMLAGCWAVKMKRSQQRRPGNKPDWGTQVQAAATPTTPCAKGRAVEAGAPRSWRKNTKTSSWERGKKGGPSKRGVTFEKTPSLSDLY